MSSLICSVSTMRPERRRVEEALQALTAREQLVLRLRFGIGMPSQNHHEIGAGLGLSPVAVRRAEVHGLQRLRALALAAEQRPFTRRSAAIRSAARASKSRNPS